MLVPSALAAGIWLVTSIGPAGPPPQTLTDVQRLLAAHRTAAALDALEHALPHSPPDAATQAVLVAAYAALCDPATSEPDPGLAGPAARIAGALADVLGGGRGSATDYRLLGEFAVAGGLPAAAITALHQAETLGAAPADWEFPMALAMLQGDRPARLLQTIRADSVQDPHLRSLLLVVRGRAQDRLGQYDEEHASLVAAAAAEPANIDAVARLGLLELARAKPAAAEPWLARAVAAAPTADPTLRLQAEYDYARHDYAGSARTYGVLVQRHAPETYEPIPPSLGKARAEIYLGEMKAATATLDATQLARGDPQLAFYRALAAYRAGAFRKAADISEGLDAKLPDFPPLNLMIGATMLANGFPATAATRLRQYLALAPENAAAKVLLDDADDRVAQPNLPVPVPLEHLLAVFGFPPTLPVVRETARRL